MVLQAWNYYRLPPDPRQLRECVGHRQPVCSPETAFEEMTRLEWFRDVHSKAHPCYHPVSAHPIRRFFLGALLQISLFGN
jgi:hypothetical protein